MLHNISFVLMPGRNVQFRGVRYYEGAYSTWRHVWERTHKEELDGATELPSDQFSRQDVLGCIFLGSLCVGIASFMRVDLSSSIARDDSWFDYWPKDLVQNIANECPHVLVISKFTVHPDFRRTNGDELNVALRLTELVSFMCQETGVDVGLGVTRNDRSVNKLAQYGGAVSLGQTVVYGKIEVDFIGFYPKAVAAAINSFPESSQRLWNDRLDYRTRPEIVIAAGF